MSDVRWDEHEKNTHSDISCAWEIFYDEGGSERPLLLMLQSIARSLAVLADEAEERRQR